MHLSQGTITAPERDVTSRFCSLWDWPAQCGREAPCGAAESPKNGGSGGGAYNLTTVQLGAQARARPSATAPRLSCLRARCWAT